MRLPKLWKNLKTQQWFYQKNFISDLKHYDIKFLKEYFCWYQCANNEACHHWIVAWIEIANEIWTKRSSKMWWQS
jgi:hypothetical protein